MTAEAVAALLRRTYELECESKVRLREAKLLRDELVNRDDKVAALQDKLAKADTETERLREKIAWYEKQLFGAKSERRILEVLSPSDQLWLGEQMLQLPEDPPTDGESVGDTEAKGRPRRKRSKPDRCEDSVGSLLHFDDSVPIEEVVIKDPQLEALPTDQVEIIGQDVTYKLAQRSPYVVIKTVRTAWKKKGEESINKATLPVVVERSLADVSFLAGLAVDKICHH